MLQAVFAVSSALLVLLLLGCGGKTADSDRGASPTPAENPRPQDSQAIRTSGESTDSSENANSSEAAEQTNLTTEDSSLEVTNEIATLGSEPTWFGFGPSEQEVFRLQNERGQPPRQLTEDEFVSLLVYHCGECHDERVQNAQGRDLDTSSGLFTVFAVYNMLDSGMLLGGVGEKSPLIKRLVNSDYSHPSAPPGRLPAATPEVVALLSGFIDSLPYTPCEFLNCAEPCSRCGPRDNSCAAENEVRRCSASRQCETTLIDSCVAQTRATLRCADEFPDDRFVAADQAEALCQELYGNTALMTPSPSFSSCNAELFLGRDTILCLAVAEGVELIEGNYVLELFAEAVEVSFNIQTVRQRARFRLLVVDPESPALGESFGQEWNFDALTGLVTGQSNWGG